jgi:hypothetical protein
MNSGAVAVTVIVAALLIAGVLAFILLKRRRDRETARIDAMSPAEREHHDAMLELNESIKAAEKSRELEVKARETRLKAARKVSSTAAAIGSRSIGSYRGKDGSVSANELRITVQGEVFPLDSNVRATVDTAGNLATSSRTTFTRVAAGGLLFGPVGAVIGGVAKKNKIHDTRELYLLVEGSNFAQLITCNPDNGPKVRQLAAAITQAGMNASRVVANRDAQMASAAAALAAEESNTANLDAAELALARAGSNTARVEAATAQMALEARTEQEPQSPNTSPPVVGV